MSLLGVDVGTTHCKGAVFSEDGTLIHAISRPTPVRSLPDGGAEHDPHVLWATVASILRELVSSGRGVRIDAIGVASMAEAGLLVDRLRLEPRTPLLAWYDTRSRAQAEGVARGSDLDDLIGRTGLYPSFKHGLSKLLWLRDSAPGILGGKVWLSVADWIVLCLTGVAVTDPTLAARTYAYNIIRRRWDEDILSKFHLRRDLFPEVLSSGAPAGHVSLSAAGSTGLEAGTPVAVSGHDHICTLLAAGVLEPGPVLDSMGTAESLIGVLRPEAAMQPLGRRELDSGLSFVPHVLPGRLCWLGGLSSSGGSVEWLRRQMGLDGSYAEVVELMAAVRDGPTGILYFPYLSGSGAPSPDPSVRAAFIGLSASDERGTLLKAVVEGTCLEIESMRRAASALTRQAVDTLCVVGGGARNETWVQIKADVSGCLCRVPELPEATALGAALAAGLGAGTFGGLDDVERIARRALSAGKMVRPEPGRHSAYRQLFEEVYIPLQGPLRAYRRGANTEVDSLG